LPGRGTGWLCASEQCAALSHLLRYSKRPSAEPHMLCTPQSEILTGLVDSCFLTTEEVDVIRWARNAKLQNFPKRFKAAGSAGEDGRAVYRDATCLETLVQQEAYLAHSQTHMHTYTRARATIRAHTHNLIHTLTQSNTHTHTQAHTCNRLHTQSHK
jgi:23S rRNA maturation mini-RNase III